MSRPAEQKTTVLVVEDDAGLRALMRTALIAAGHRVIDVGDGLAALRWVEHETPSAVVLDMALPRLGGRDVHRELKSRPNTRNVPVVVVSGTDITDLNPNEFVCLLRKPVPTDAIVRAISNGIDDARRVGALA